MNHYVLLLLYKLLIANIQQICELRTINQFSNSGNKLKLHQKSVISFSCKNIPFQHIELVYINNKSLSTVTILIENNKHFFKCFI